MNEEITDKKVIHHCSIVEIVGPEATTQDKGMLVRMYLLGKIAEKESVDLDFSGVTHLSREFLAEIGPIVCSLMGHRLVRCINTTPSHDKAFQTYRAFIKRTAPELGDYGINPGEKVRLSEEFAKELNEVCEKVVLMSNREIENLTREQTIDCLKQALLSGDFERLVQCEEGTQKVVYIPGKAAEIAKQQMVEMKQLSTRAVLLSSFLGGLIKHWAKRLDDDSLTLEDLAIEVKSSAGLIDETTKQILHGPDPGE